MRNPSERESLEIAVGAVLTQNTAWTNVEKAIRQLHSVRALNHSKTLLNMSVARMERLIRSSGYFRQKARRLKILLRHCERRGGIGRWLRVPLGPLREDLLSVPGVGPETADSILLYAGARPAFVVDAYTLRIGGRLGWFSAFEKGSAHTYERMQTFLVQRLPKSVAVYQEFHALLVVFAKFYCRTEPLCGDCPLLTRCEYANAHAN